MAHDVVLPADGRLERVDLRHVEDLNVVQVNLTVAESEVLLNEEASDDLTTPRLNVLTLDFDISREQNDFSSNVEAVVEICSGLFLAEMVEHEVTVGLDFTSHGIIADDEHFVHRIGRVACREKCQSVALNVVKTRSNEE